MTPDPTVPAAKAPAPFLAGLGLSAGFMAFVAWDQSHWWRVKEDYSFGWLVPLFTAYVVYDRWPLITARLRELGIDPEWTEPVGARVSVAKQSITGKCAHSASTSSWPASRGRTSM